MYYLFITLNKKDKIEKSLILCSSPFLEENDWEKIENKTIKVFGKVMRAQ